MTMKAVILSGKPDTRAGITDFLTVSDNVPVPDIKSDQVLVRVRATSLNIEDIMNGIGRRNGTSLTATKEDPVVLARSSVVLWRRSETKSRNLKLVI